MLRSGARPGFRELSRELGTWQAMVKLTSLGKVHILCFGIIGRPANYYTQFPVTILNSLIASHVSYSLPHHIVSSVSSSASSTLCANVNVPANPQNQPKARFGRAMDTHLHILRNPVA
jgi:hypothetical protein